MRLFLIFLFNFAFFSGSGFPVKKSENHRVLPDIDALFCNSEKLRNIVFSALENISDTSAIAVDQIQSEIESSLQPVFQSSSATWLVTTTSYHRVNGYVDDRAAGIDTFCAVNDVNLNLYIVVMKIDN